MTAVRSSSIKVEKSIHPADQAPDRLATGTGPRQALKGADAYESPETRSIIRLVEAAADLVREKGESAFAEFGQKDGRWQEGGAYVFVLDAQGNMLVHPDAELKARNQLDLKDINGRPIIRGLIEAATALPDRPDGWYHYQWPVPGGLLPGWKSSYVRRVETPSGTIYIVGSGMYNMQMDKTFIEDVVDRAASLVHEQGEAAFDALRDSKGPFVFMDTYVFVQDPDGTELMNAAMPYLEGKNLIGVTDLQGKAFIRDQIAAAMTDGSAWLEHEWYLPGSNRPARKQTFVRKVRHDGRTFIVGSGFYGERVMPTARMRADIVKTSWQGLTEERLTEVVSRQVIHGEKATLARLTLKAGGGVARHHHVNEEYAWVVSGALEYRLDDRTVTVRAGEVIVVPSNVPHAIVAPEDSICMYFFAPVREDWLKGEDQYLRKLH